MSARESIIPVFVPHLGCPNDCVFCNQRRISGTQTPASAEDVRKAVEEGLRRLNADRKAEKKADMKPQLAFYGGSFTAIPVKEQEALLEAAAEYLRKGLIGSVRLSTRPDAIDASVLARLKKYGVETIEIGAQSMDNEVLRLSGRGHTAEDVESAAKQIKAAGFRLILQMMTGLPGDTGSRSLMTAERLIALQPDGVRIYPTVIVKDTALYDLWKAGRYREHTVDEAVEYCAELLTRFRAAGIPVIRLGLNPTEELSDGAAAGGAYHPALGELVKSRLLRGEAEQLLEEYRTAAAGGTDPLKGAKVVLETTPGLISQLTGQHRCNIAYLTERFGLSELKVTGLPVRKTSVMQQGSGTENGLIRLVSVEISLKSN